MLTYGVPSFTSRPTFDEIAMNEIITQILSMPPPFNMVVVIVCCDPDDKTAPTTVIPEIALDPDINGV